MTDIVFCNVPMVNTKAPFSAPAILKSVVEANGYTSKTIDFNIESQIGNLKSFWQFGQGDALTIQSAHKCANKWAKQILYHRPKWVGISVFCYTCQIATEMLCIALKSIDKNIKIVLGGNGMGKGGINGDFSWPQNLLASKTIDAYIRSEAEKSIIELLRGNLDFPGINENKNFDQLDNLDIFPHPNYSDYSLKQYPRNTLPITGSRGCVRQCTFCDIHTHWNKFVFRTGQSICDEMRELSDIHQIYRFAFTDSLVNGSMKAYRDFIHALAKHNKSHQSITWSGQFIARSHTQMTEEDWKMTSLSGAWELSIGVETGSDRVRNDDIKKKFTNEDLDFCVEMAHKYNIKIWFLMLIGYPTEHEQDFQDTMNLFTKYKKYKDIILPNLGTTCAILPRTPLFDFAQQNNFTMGKTENEWWWEQNPNLTFKERLRRRVVLGEHCKSLGYKLNDKTELETMAYMWNNYKLNQYADLAKLRSDEVDSRNTQYYS